MFKLIVRLALLVPIAVTFAVGRWVGDINIRLVALSKSFEQDQPIYKMEDPELMYQLWEEPMWEDGTFTIENNS